MSKLATIAAAGLLFAGVAEAQAPAAANGPSDAGAEQAVRTAVETCKANGYPVVAVVVDSSGGVKALLVADGVTTLADDYVVRKAVTALTFKKPSGVVVDEAKTDAILADRLKNDPKLLARAGGLPIVVKGEVIGAIGVGGAPGGDKDEVCAKAALAKIAG